MKIVLNTKKLFTKPDFEFLTTDLEKNDLISGHGNETSVCENLCLWPCPYVRPGPSCISSIEACSGLLTCPWKTSFALPLCSSSTK